MNVLDHGHIKLVAHMGNDLSIINAARVSYGAAAEKWSEKESKLLNYLWTNAHTSPFEHVTFTFEVKAPIFVFRQWHRHRTWSFNEISARYTELPEEFYVPFCDDITKQAAGNKQCRTNEEVETASACRMFIEQSNQNAFNTYHELLKRGVARELARTVLPVSTYSKMFATVNLLNLIKFLNLRDHAHAQYEIRVYAQAIKELIQPIVPNVMKVVFND